MQSSKILYLLAICFICINARIVRRQKRILQRSANSPTSCNCPSFIEVQCGCKSILEPTYGGLGTCNCQNMYLDELSNGVCGCKYVDSYGVLDPELSNYGRVPAIKLPKMIASYESGVPMPAINLPGLYDLVVDLPSCQCQAMPPYVIDLPSCQCQAMPPYVIDLPSCPCQRQASYHIVDSPCNCMAQRPFVDYLSSFEVPSPMLKVPYAEPYYLQNNCQLQAMQLPSCGCGCQNVPCRCDSRIKVSNGLPCGCQNPINCGCQNVMQYGPQLPALEAPCACQACQLSPVELLPCGCQNPINCGCQNVMQYGPQLPALEAPCACQACQLSPVELPVYGYGCQSLPPRGIGCEGKYLRQVTLQPPFL